jgi:hypothetical protein
MDDGPTSRCSNVRICSQARAISSGCELCTRSDIRNAVVCGTAGRGTVLFLSYGTVHTWTTLTTVWRLFSSWCSAVKKSFHSTRPCCCSRNSRYICHILRAVRHSETEKDLERDVQVAHGARSLRGDARAHPIRVLLRGLGRYTRAHPSGSGRVSYHSCVFSVLLADTTMLALEVSNQEPARP